MLKTFFKSVLVFFSTLFVLALMSVGLVGCSHSKSWKTADRSSAKIAPLPSEAPEAIVQIYTARAFSWRGYFGVHPWVSVKPKNAEQYTVYQVLGWNVRRGLSAVSVKKDIPDRIWFDKKPTLIFELRGEQAEQAIPKIAKAVESYSYNNQYGVYPGPNSNTFVAHIIRSVPELTVELPPTAIGKDRLNNNQFFAWSESGTGVQASLYGLLGFTVGAAEGIELNIIGMNFGIDFLSPALKLPFIGRLGFKDQPL